MQKLFLGSLLLIPILLVGGVAQPETTAEEILFATIARYVSLNTFKAVKVMEWKTLFIENRILGESRPGFCGSKESLTEEQCKILLGKQFKIKLNQTAYLEEQNITIQLIDVNAPNCLKGEACYGNNAGNTIKITVKDLEKETSKEFTLHWNEKGGAFGFEIECLGIGSNRAGLIIRKPTTKEFETHKTETQIIYKQPSKFKLVEEDKIIITKYGWNYIYDKENNTAYKTTSKMWYLNPIFLPMLIKTFLEYYEPKYLGTEEINGKEHYVIQFTPKQELDWEGDKLLEQKIWITKDYLIAKMETYENGEWKYKTTFTNIETNTYIPDSEFEPPKETKFKNNTQPKIIPLDKVDKTINQKRKN